MCPWLSPGSRLQGLGHQPCLVTAPDLGLAGNGWAWHALGTAQEGPLRQRWGRATEPRRGTIPQHASRNKLALALSCCFLRRGPDAAAPDRAVEDDARRVQLAQVRVRVFDLRAGRRRTGAIMPAASKVPGPCAVDARGVGRAVDRRGQAKAGSPVPSVEAPAPSLLAGPCPSAGVW